jgi:hypothetical protein
MGMLPRQFKTLVEMLRKELGAVKEAIQNQEHAQRKGREAADAQWGKVPRIIASAIRPTQHEIADAQARHDQTYRQQERAIKVQTRLVKATWCAFAGACVYAAVAGWQGCTARQQLRMDQRPWLKMSIPDFQRTFKAGDGLSIPVTLINTGKTPAERITAGVVILLVNSGEEPYIRPGGICQPGCKSTLWQRLWRAMPWVHRPTDGVAVNGLIIPIIYSGDFAPNEEVQLLDTNRFDESTVKRILTPTEVQALSSKQKYIVLYGTIWYFDVFGTNHWTNFCIAKYPDGSQANSEKCAHYGDVDSGY